jgi:kinesin family protein 1
MSTPQCSRLVSLYCLKKILVLIQISSFLELARGAKPLIRMQGNQTFIDPPESGSNQDSKGRATERKTMTFSFDKSYWSAGPRDEPQYCSQQTLYDDLGKELLDHGFAGFNACILACEWLSLLCIASPDILGG